MPEQSETIQQPVAAANDAADDIALKPYVEPIALPPGVTLALLPILGYAAVFAYEIGKCKYYRIPPELIRLDLTTGLIVAAGLGGLLLLFPVFLTFLSLETLEFEYFVRMRHSTVFVVILLTLAGIYLTPALFVLALGLTFFYVVFSVTKIHREKPERKLAQRKYYAGYVSNVSLFTDYIGWKRSIYSFVVLVALLCAYNTGYVSAVTQAKFLTNGNYVVVAIYGDSLIMLDKVRERVAARGSYLALGRRIRILSLQRNSSILLERQTLGLMPRDDMGNDWLK